MYSFCAYSNVRCIWSKKAVGKQAAILNKIVQDLQHKKHIEHETLKELVGHTPKEVICGAILGVIIGILMS